MNHLVCLSQIEVGAVLVTNKIIPLNESLQSPAAPHRFDSHSQGLQTSGRLAGLA